MLQQLRPISEAIDKPEVATTVLSYAEQYAVEHFWQFRVQMNPRLTLKGMWFPKTLARQLRKFWDDYKAGKRPVLLLMTPPQHGKSLSVIDFIAWAIGHDPELRDPMNAALDEPLVPRHFRQSTPLQHPQEPCEWQTRWQMSSPSPRRPIPRGGLSRG